MKKLILHSLLFAVCFSLITSCTKHVKVPAGKVTALTTTTKTATTTSTTTTQTGNQSGHTCSGSGSGGSGGVH